MDIISSPRRRCMAVRHLDDARLLKEWAYINGKWQNAESGEVIEVTNPAEEQGGEGSVVGCVPRCGAVEARAAIAAARAAFPAWRDLLPQERGRLLRAWGEAMLENRDDLALIMTLEQGKPLHEAKGEIEYAASFLEWFAEEARRVNGEVVNGHLPQRQMLVKRRPVGVTAAITPWNFPSAMITRKAGAALAAGCTMIVRPATETPLSALALAELADRVGIPAGVFSVVPGSRDIVAELCANPVIRTVSFTGSTEVGRTLLRQSADTVKRMSMELGGHAPFIVFPDVDLDDAAAQAVAAKFQTSGQDCLAANRIYVHADVYEDFLALFTRKVQALRVGNGLSEGVDVGPLMNARAVDKCQQHVDDAMAKGARRLCGGGVHELGGLFFDPTVLADVTPAMAISSEETFGPVAAVSRFGSEAELSGLANHAELGLMAYLFTNDHDRVCRITEMLEYGMVAVNCVKVTGGPIPFGGVKQSGLGREGGHWGLDEYLDTKYICAAIKAA
ncbi:NAD-dependent succinate-semialdehyde dehydrogenase [Oceanidesulfovibrio marinus]|nr:NAD-dependent succinate-semialdehyde dehydrogenase [Oceanidesulfovibrio marinus]